ncbi:MAG: VanZ like family protein, partial [Marmoricola sp.]|nr:VanZ like family protein [Marmoricola sp.]
RAALCGFLISLVIEVTQLVGDLTVSPGRGADVDDLIGNSVGTVIGYLAFSLLVTIPAVARLATRASWTSSPTTPAQRGIASSSRR